ncbi:sensor histidine kinase [Tateyamaria sp.]|uniref:sensor histidine kinase n=1 Tax=Tateyamaria sp. TaxID=1929288 RepID=UPI003B21E3FB
MQNAPNASAAKARSAELVDAAREASNLTNKLLSFERASGTDLLNSGTRLDLKALIAQVRETFSQQNTDRGVIVTMRLPDTPVMIRGDAVMLQEAVLNLMSNAVIHGGPELSEIAVTLTKARGTAILTVQDDGMGIAPDKHVEAISRFSQAGGGPGSGLGLPIALRVMENHGGGLEILDNSQGACIRITLPLDERPTH